MDANTTVPVDTSAPPSVPMNEDKQPDAISRSPRNEKRARSPSPRPAAESVADPQPPLKRTCVGENKQVDDSSSGESGEKKADHPALTASDGTFAPAASVSAPSAPPPAAPARPRIPKAKAPPAAEQGSSTSTSLTTSSSSASLASSSSASSAVAPSAEPSSSSASSAANPSGSPSLASSSTSLTPPIDLRIPKWKPRKVEDSYEQKKVIGEGTYGHVQMYTNKSGCRFALKQIKMAQEKEGFPLTAIREIRTLKMDALNHENIVHLHDVLSNEKGSVFMAFECLDHDITGLLDSEDRVPLPAPQIKLYMKGLLAALSHAHANNVIHRDIKGANVLIGNNGEVRLADWGLARNTHPDGQKAYTKRVVTLWYRAPELLLGEAKYTDRIDVWSAGCLFAEMLSRKPLFPGSQEMEQMKKIWELCGTPTAENWQGLDRLPLVSSCLPATVPPQPRVLVDFCKGLGCSPQAIDLLDRMLTLDPKKRISAKEAALHPYIWSEFPPPMNPKDHPKYAKNYYEYNSKVRAQQRQNQPPPPLPAPGPAPGPGPAHPHGPEQHGHGGRRGPGGPHSHPGQGGPQGSRGRWEGPRGPPGHPMPPMAPVPMVPMPGMFPPVVPVVMYPPQMAAPPSGLSRLAHSTNPPRPRDGYQQGDRGPRPPHPHHQQAGQANRDSRDRRGPPGPQQDRDRDRDRERDRDRDRRPDPRDPRDPRDGNTNRDSRDNRDNRDRRGPPPGPSSSGGPSSAPAPSSSSSSAPSQPGAPSSSSRPGPSVPPSSSSSSSSSTSNSFANQLQSHMQLHK